MILDHYTTDDGVTYTRPGWPDLRRFGDTWTCDRVGIYSTPEEAIVAWCDYQQPGADEQLDRATEALAEAQALWAEAHTAHLWLYEMRHEVRR